MGVYICIKSYRAIVQYCNSYIMGQVRILHGGCVTVTVVNMLYINTVTSLESDTVYVVYI